MTINEKLKERLDSLNVKVHSNNANAQDFKALLQVENELEQVDPVFMADIGY